MTEPDFAELFADLPDRKLLRVDEVAKFFEVRTRTIYNWYNADPPKLLGTNIGGVLRIYRSSVISAVIANHGRKNGEENPQEVEKTMQECKKAQSATRPRSTSWVSGWK